MSGSAQPTTCAQNQHDVLHFHAERHGARLEVGLNLTVVGHKFEQVFMPDHESKRVYFSTSSISVPVRRIQSLMMQKGV